MNAKNTLKLLTGETLDSIKNIQIIQAKNGYRFSIDAVLLEQFISARHSSNGIELGTGSGVISILLAKRLSNIHIKAVELQKTLAHRAKRNVKLNDLEDRLEIVQKDIKDLKGMYATNSFNFVYTNPPFRKPKTGRMSMDKERAIARHEIEISLKELISTASYLLKHSGRLYLIYHPFRLVELISFMKESRLEPKRMRFVHSKKGDEAKMVLIEAAKGSGIWLKVEPPLYLYEKGKTYSKEVLEILDKAE
jgi:tRNA1Val (adenine37-N6)-methyltransferase